MKNARTSLHLLCFAAALAPAWAGAAEPDPALAKLAECMKLKAATPVQQACLNTVQSLRRAAAAVPLPVAPAASKAAPGAPPKVIDAPADVKQASQTLGIDLKGMDVQTAMMAIETQRANLLERQLQAQMESVQARNNEIARLNTLLGKLKAQRPSGVVTDARGNLAASRAESRATYDMIRAAGLTIPTGTSEVNEAGSAGIYAAQQKTFDEWVGQIKSKLDAQNATQQVDMLRMQTVVNQRNAAFETMTNYIKKMSDNRGAIIGNTR